MSTEDPSLTNLFQSLEISESHIGSSTPISDDDFNATWRNCLYLKIYNSDKPVRFKTLENTLKAIWGRFGLHGIQELMILFLWRSFLMLM